MMKKNRYLDNKEQLAELWDSFYRKEEEYKRELEASGREQILPEQQKELNFLLSQITSLECSIKRGEANLAGPQIL